MSFTARIWRIIHITAETVGITRSQRPRKANLSYEVSLKNSGSLFQSCTLILPMPPSDENQQISAAEGIPTASYQRTERRFQNAYMVWDLMLAPQEEKGVEQQIIADIKSVDDRKLSLSLATPKDYSEAQRETLNLFLTPSQHLTLPQTVVSELLKDIHPERLSVYSLLEQIQNIVCSKLTYGSPIPGLCSAEQALEQRTVDCGGFDALFVALCQACGIPARIVSGFWVVPTRHAMHAWVEAFHPLGHWIPVDPSVEYLRRQNRSSRLSAIGFIGSDRIVYSRGCDFTIDIEGRSLDIDILQTPLLLQEGEEIKMTYTFT